MDSPFLTVLLPSLLVVPAMGLLSSIRSTGPVVAELKRKSLHVGIGVAALAFPFFLHSATAVLSALGLVVAWMLAVRRVPALTARFGCVLTDAGRHSSGEFYYATAIGALLLLPHPGYLSYAIPLLILTFSDSLAAVVGRTMPLGPLPGPLKGKSVSGSLAFLSSAFLVATAPLLATTGLDDAGAFQAGAAIAVSTCLTEAISRGGSDNLAIPLVAWAILALVL